MAVLEISKGSKNKVGLAQKVRAGYLVSVQFLRECKIELKKVKWPTKKELISMTSVVIILILVLAAFLGIVDFGLIKIIKLVIG